jgi:Resolvase, N terminal domain
LRLLAPIRVLGLVVWKLDRLGRSPRHLLDTVAALGERGIAFRSLRDPIDTFTAAGKLVFNLFVSGSNDGTVRVLGPGQRTPRTHPQPHRRTRPGATAGSSAS